MPTSGLFFSARDLHISSWCHSTPCVCHVSARTFLNDLRVLGWRRHLVWVRDQDQLDDMVREVQRTGTVGTGIRRMHSLIRIRYGHHVPRRFVGPSMRRVDPTGPAARVHNRLRRRRDLIRGPMFRYPRPLLCCVA